jgi:hypothetical protein
LGRQAQQPETGRQARTDPTGRAAAQARQAPAEHLALLVHRVLTDLMVDQGTEELPLRLVRRAPMARTGASANPIRIRDCPVFRLSLCAARWRLLYGTRYSCLVSSCALSSAHMYPRRQRRLCSLAVRGSGGSGCAARWPTSQRCMLQCFSFVLIMLIYWPSLGTSLVISSTVSWKPTKR